MEPLTLITTFLSFLLLSSTSSSTILRVRQSTQPISKCCFSLRAQSSDANIHFDMVVEDTIGEARLGGTFPQASFCVSSSFQAGSLQDYRGHPCLVEASAHQFRCVEAGVETFDVFTISDAGLLQHNASDAFVACPAPGPGNDGSWNIYGGSGSHEANDSCVDISLIAGGFDCISLGRPDSTTSSNIASISTATDYSTSTTVTTIASQTSNLVPVSGFTTVASPSSSQASSPTLVSTAPSTSGTSSSSCPANINAGEYLVPQLLVPVSALSPDTSFGTVFSPIITPSNSTIYGFDIPVGTPYNGICSLVFLFPYGNQAVFPYEFTGIEEEVGRDGGIEFNRLLTEINSSTTYNNAPARDIDYGKAQIIPGNYYTISTFECPEGQQLSVEASSVGGVGLQYFQNDQSVAIGLYVVPCA